MTLVIDNPFPLDFPRAYGEVSLSAGFRERDEDFYVEEVLGFPLTGEGEHLCLFIEKQSHNTHWVAAELARYAGISEKDIGVCGRKDRHAITRQWFSLYYPPNKPGHRPVDWDQFSMEGVKIIRLKRHSKKLRLGDHQYNHFTIRLRRVSSLKSPDTPLSENDQQNIRTAIVDKLNQGVPNYFGVQRFGREGGNLLMANNWLVNRVPPPRKQRSMVLSAARSYLFNRVLAYRVNHQNWQQVIKGEVQDVPTGPLWGRGRLGSLDEALLIEQESLRDFQSWCERLEHQGLHQDRRELVLWPKNLSCDWQDGDLVLAFDLPSGTFATAVLNEIVILNNPALGSP